MKRIFLEQAKKTISVLLAVLLLTTCWVFVAPEAKAASPYTLTIKYTWTSGGSSGNIKVNYYNLNADGTANTGSTGQQVLINSLGSDLPTGSKATKTYNLDGFPYEIVITDEAAGCGQTNYSFQFHHLAINGTSLGTEGTWTTNNDERTVKMDGSGSDNYLTWSVPKLSGVQSNPTAQTVTVNKNGVSDSKSFTATYKDQYGVTMAGSGATATFDPALTGASITMSGNTATVTAGLSVFDNLSNYNTSTGKGSSTLKITNNGVVASCTVTFQAPQYTVSWKDGNGGTLKTDTVTYGNTPSYTGATPTKTATPQYTYTFNNTWSPAITAAKADATYTAQFDSTVNKYTVTWNNHDGSNLETDTDQTYGTTPTYDGETPTKDYDGTYHYVFDKWDPTVSTVTGATTYTAQFTSIPHKYSYESNADYKTHTGTCSCGHTVTVDCAGGDTATCSKRAICDTCGGEYGDYGAHSLGEGVGETPATCLTTGTKAHWQCTLCHKYFEDEAATKEISSPTSPALGHKFTNEVAAKEATCKEAGNEAYKQCSACNLYFAANAATNAPGGYEDNSRFVIPKKTEHSYKYTSNGNNTHTGTCTVCGTTTTGNCTGGEATCEVRAICTVCNAAYGDYAAHKSVADNKVDPTCTTPGLTAGSHCSVCGDIIEAQKEIPALGHTFGAITAKVDATCSTAGREAYKQCSTCRKYFAADAEEDSTDAKGGVTAFDIPALGHTYSEEYTVDKKATCTTFGSKARYCIRNCGAKIDNQPISPRGHNYVDTDVATPATCTTPGVMNQVCSNVETAEYAACTHTSTRVIEAKGHTYVDTPYKAPTCTEPGNKAYRYCSVCEKYFAEGAGSTSTEAYDNADGFVLDALGHKHATEFTVDIKASCTEIGSKSRHCLNGCGDKIDVTPIPLRAHVIVDNGVQTEATCTTPGVMNQKCSNTETAEYKACEYTTTREIPAKGHTFGETIASVAATCTTPGNKAYKPCTSCNMYYAHDAGTYATDGKANAEAFTIPELGHDYEDDYTIDVPPSCNETGSESRHCTRCDATTDSREIPATGNHNYAIEVEETKIKATCEEDGKVQMKCRCGELGNWVVLPKLGHADADKDHQCDNGCGVTQGTCEDINKDHKCDYGCTKYHGTHEDNDKDHNCDYGCSEKIGEHKDTNFDHNCDYGCNDKIGEHKDSADDGDHLCDYGCKVVLEDCSDNPGDGDHKCDVCGEDDVTVHTPGEEVRVIKKEATCDEEGIYDSFYYCTDCKVETQRNNDLSLAKLPHDWNETVYTWEEDGSACVATRTCKDFDSHTETITATVTEEIATNATCTEDGTIRYTAKFDEDWAETQTKDIVNIPAIGHADADFDHECDNGCDVFQGVHEDINYDHECDYGCTELIGKNADGNCDDKDFNHECDYGCREVIGKHEDSAEDDDHVCDYGCGEVLTKCEDKDLDHACDNGCTQHHGTHEDENKDHVCDYGCEERIGGECDEGENKDHKCDYCGAILSSFIDENPKDHICDCGCENTNGDCYDDDHDHKCDYCGKELTKCEDTNFDHKCDNGCDQYFGEHIDEGKDHNCDYGCDEPIGIHADYNKDHVCEYGCDVAIGTCSDSETDNDHVCDYGCGKEYNECVDEDKDHYCDIGCGAIIGDHKDFEKDGDHLCEYCNEEASDHIKGDEAKIENEVEATCGTAGKYDTVYYCTECNEEIERTTTVIPQGDHDWDVDAIKYTWNTDGSACVAVCVCKNDPTHIERFAAVIDKEVKTEATCQEMGTTEYTATFEEAWLTPQTKMIVNIPTTDHDEEVVSGYAATCTENGLTDGKKCKDCGEVTVEQTVIEAPGHNWTEATCEEPKTCSVCDETEGEALGHDWTEATCTAPKTCSVCNETEGEALGHEWTNATCEAPKTCSVCGTTEGTALEHTWTDATCTAPRTCSVCGTTFGDSLGHKAGEAVTENNVPATCYAEGSYDLVVYCTVCNAQISRTIEKTDKIAHTPGETVRENEVAATCYAEGSYDEVVRCTVAECNAIVSNTTVKIKKIAHTPGEAKTENRVEATCYAKGSYDEVVYCTVEACKAQISRTTKEIEKKEHTPAAAVRENEVAATCTTAGSYDEVVYCSVAGCNAQISSEEKTIAATGHAWVDADCDTPKTCSVCKTIEGEALGHKWIDATCTAPKTCSVCGVTEGKVKAHSWVDATCAAPKTCTVCGKTEGTATGHSFTKIISTTAATCIAEGSIVYECTTCPTGENLEAATKTEVLKINARNHASEETIKVGDFAAECGKDGYTGDIYHKCCYDKTKPADQNKSALFAKGTVIPATGEHNFIKAVPEYLIDEYIRDTEENITDYTSKTDNLTYEAKVEFRHDDNKWYHIQKCEDCGMIVEGACYTFEHTANCVETDTCEVCKGLCSIKEPGKHKGNLTPIAAIAATCNKAGQKAYYECDYCNKSFFDAGAKQEITDDNKANLVIAATGNHKIDETKTPSSNGNGTHTYSCTECSTSVTKNCSGGEANCKAAAVCEYCKTAYGAVNPSKHAKGTIVLGRVEPDKCKPGVTGKEVYECCPDIVVFAGKEIPANETHSWVETKPETDNCEQGYTITNKCSYCGETKTTEVTAGEHKLTKVVYETEKDCTKERKVYYACENCNFADKSVVIEGKTYNYITVDVIPAKASCSWSSWTYEQKATCVVEGKRTRTCSVCKKVETETLDKVGHTIKTEKGFAATCDAQGKQDYAYCTVPDCPYRKGGQPIGSLKGYEKYKNSTGADIPALGHQDKNGDDYCDNCGRFEGTTSGGNCNCICHKNNGLMKFFYKILNFFWKLFKIEKKCACGATHW